MKRKILFSPWLWIAPIIAPGICFSQDIVKDSSQIDSTTSIVSLVAGDFWHVASSPFRMSKKDALTFAAFLALNTGLVYGIDGAADEEFALEKRHAYLRPAEELADLGDLYDRIGSGKILAGLTATMLAGGLIFKDRKLLTTSRLLIESSILTGFITHSNKFLFGRSRPYTGRGQHDFHPFKFSKANQYHSFPSGHASAVFSMMTVVAKQYDQWWIKYPAYTLAVSVALQRMDDRQHWFSDVVVGGAIGYWVSNTLVNRHKRESRKPSVSPYFLQTRIGVRWVF